jgi:hypothetical protein
MRMEEKPVEVNPTHKPDLLLVGLIHCTWLAAQKIDAVLSTNKKRDMFIVIHSRDQKTQNLSEVIYINPSIVFAYREDKRKAL